MNRTPRTGSSSTRVGYPPSVSQADWDTLFAGVTAGALLLILLVWLLRR